MKILYDCPKRRWAGRLKAQNDQISHDKLAKGIKNEPFNA